MVITDENATASRDGESNAPPQVPDPVTYVVHVTELTATTKALSKIVGSETLESLQKVTQELVAAETAEVVRKIRIMASEAESTSVQFSPRDTRRRTGRNSTLPTTSIGSLSIGLSLQTVSDESVGIQMTIDSSRIVQTVTSSHQRRQTLETFVEASLNKPSFVFGSSGTKSRVIVVTVTR